MIECADGRRMHVLFFSTQGMRSLADKIAGKDYDGDECCLINWQELVQLCTSIQPPYDPHHPPALPSTPPSVARGKRKVCGASVASGTSRASGTSVRASGTSANTSQKGGTSQLGQRLTFNFVFARFLCSPLVQTAGRQWMVFTDKFGANSVQSKQIDRTSAGTETVVI
jgi:hypothetical protein